MYLKQALALAEIRRGYCAPNPAVGAVVVKNNQILGTGYHYASGHPHAEVEALKELGESAKDATIYVTLEPCCHHSKRTPPCTELLIKRGIKKVVYGFQDPNPEVAGHGEQMLRDAGIECVHDPLPAINEFYRSYAYWWQTKKPLVTAKLALTLDGKIAGPGGQRVAISGSDAQQFTHQQRKRSDAILTTARTIFYDNPLLNVRLDQKQDPKPVYVLDRELTTTVDANIFTTAAHVTFLYSNTVTAEKIAKLETRGVRCVNIASNEHGLDLTEVIQVIGKDGVHDLWIEAGGKLFAAFATAGLLHYAYLYMSSKWFGQNAQSAFTNTTDFLTKAQAQQWQILGNDVVCKLIW